MTPYDQVIQLLHHRTSPLEGLNLAETVSALARIVELHHPVQAHLWVDDRVVQMCGHCWSSTKDENWRGAQWPCETIQALRGAP